MTKEEEKQFARRVEKLETRLHETQPPESDTERRMAALEKSVSDLNSRVFDGHKWFVTVLFSAVAIMLTFFGFFSRQDVKDSTANMERRVDEKTRDMEAKVSALVGETLKKPFLEVLHGQPPLDGQTIELNAPGNQSPIVFYLDGLFLRNSGQKRTDPISILISTSLGGDYFQGDWEASRSFDTNYTMAYSSTRHTTIDAGETANIQNLQLMFDLNHARFASNVLCKIEVFYGGQKSAEAKFQLKLKTN